MSAGAPATAVRAERETGPYRLFDPLKVRAPLGEVLTLYPLGFPVEIAANRREVLQAAEQSWRAYPKLFEEPPYRVRVFVEGEAPATGPPAYRQQGHLFVVACDAANFAVSDATRRLAACWISRGALARPEWFRSCLLEAVVFAGLTQLHLTPLHAACVARNGRGILLCGPAGAGKSTLAYACVRQGWTYLADESPLLVRDREDRLVVGKPGSLKLALEAARLFPELSDRTPEPDGGNGQPAILVSTAGFETAFSVEADLVVLLERADEAAQLSPVEPGAALAQLLAEIPFFGEEVYAEQKRSLERLLASGAWRLRYRSPDEAVQQLHKLTEGGV
jgi:hypothetical protein